MSTQKGYALVFLVVLLPIFITVLFFFFGVLNVFQLTQNLQNQCLLTQLKEHNKASQKLNQLLKLNPKSVHLRLQKQKAARLKSKALAQNDFVLFNIAEEKINKIHLQQVALDFSQKNLLNEFYGILKIAPPLVEKKLNQVILNQITFLKSLIKINVHLSPGQKNLFDLKMQTPNMPTQTLFPVDSELAPEYRTSDSFIPQTTLAQNWHITAQIQNLFKDYKIWNFTGRCQTRFINSNLPLIENDKKDIKTLSSWSIQVF